MTWVSALSVAAAVWLAWDDGTARLRRLARREVVRVPRWLAGRPGAMSMSKRMWVGVVAGAAALLWLPGGWGLVVAACLVPGVALGLGFLETASSRRASAAQIAELPTALDFLAAALSAGAPLSRAVRQVAAVVGPATSEILDGVLARVSVGSTDAEAWRRARDHPVWGEAARDMARSAESGTALVTVLEVHALAARRRHRELLEIRAKRVGVKVALPLMCCFLPAFLAIGVAPIVMTLVARFIG